MSEKIAIYGPSASPYVRALRMGLSEKGLAHDLIELPLPDYKSPEYLSERHPFGKIPAVEIDGFKMFETQAILRLIEDLHPEPSLQPATPFERARMNQMLGIIDCYGWPSWGGGILLNRFIRPLFGEAPNEEEIAAATPQARTSIKAVADLQSETGPYLCGERLSFADLIIYQIMSYFEQTPEGGPTIADYPRFAAWLAFMAERDGAQARLAA